MFGDRFGSSMSAEAPEEPAPTAKRHAPHPKLAVSSGSTAITAVRLAPGDELKSALLKVVAESGVSSAWVVTCVGYALKLGFSRSVAP